MLTNEIRNLTFDLHATWEALLFALFLLLMLPFREHACCLFVSARGGAAVSVGGAGPSLGVGPSGVACLGLGRGGGASEARVPASLRVGAAGLPVAPGIGSVALDLGAATPFVGAAGGSPRVGAGRSAPGFSARSGAVLACLPRTPLFSLPSLLSLSPLTCPLPGCCFRVFRHAVVRGHHEARRKHLSDHGLAPKDFPPLQDAGPKTRRRRTPAEALPRLPVGSAASLRAATALPPLAAEVPPLPGTSKRSLARFPA